MTMIDFSIYPPLMTTKATAIMLSMSVRTIYRRLSDGDFEAKKSRGRTLVILASVREHMESCPNVGVPMKG